MIGRKRLQYRCGMKKIKYLTAVMLFAAIACAGSGCAGKKILNRLTELNCFDNKYENAILQTEIAGTVSEHFRTNDTIKKKALLVAIDGMRAECLEYFFNEGIGAAKIADDGGLYWTKPANLETDAKVDIGVNFLSVMTGKEPSEFDVLKSTDAKREKPYSLMANLSEKYMTKFLTDNANYIDTQLNAEIKAKQSARLVYKSFTNLEKMMAECTSSLADTDFIALAISAPYQVAAGNYKMSNARYLSTLLNLNCRLGDIYRDIKARENEDWLVIVTSTCGGKTALHIGEEEGNNLTFMLTNKKL